MPTLLHISDLHFGKPFLPDVAEAVVEHSRSLAPDVVVVSGDLTQRAREEQFRQAAEYLERFERPVVVTPGNHDVPFYRFWERFLLPYRYYRRYVSSDLNTATEVAGLRNTTARAVSSPRCSRTFAVGPMPPETGNSGSGVITRFATPTCNTAESLAVATQAPVAARQAITTTGTTGWFRNTTNPVLRTVLRTLRPSPRKERVG